MKRNEWSQFWHHAQLDVALFQAFYAAHAYPRHSHDYYVVALVDRGVQSFMCAGAKYVTPAGGLIFLNPGEAHTGEPVDEAGFQYRALYPTVAHMQMALREVNGSADAMLQFATPRADSVRLARLVDRLHRTLVDNDDQLESESLFLLTLVELIQQAGNCKAAHRKVGHEDKAIAQARAYIHENYAHGVALADLAQHVHLSPYHLLRTFRNSVGMPPHSYLESVRIRHAQRLLAAGGSLAQVAQDVGFSSQGHFTNRFKQIIGVTPGAYADQVRM